MSPALSKEEQPGAFAEDAGPQKHTVVQNCMEAAHTGEASNRFTQAPCLSRPLDSPDQTLCLLWHLASTFWYFWQRPVVLHLIECLENINQDWFWCPETALQWFHIPEPAMYLNPRLWQGWLLLEDASLARPKHSPRMLAVFSQTSYTLCAKRETNNVHSGSGQVLHTPAITIAKAPRCSKSLMKFCWVFCCFLFLQSCKVKSCYRNESETIRAAA